MSSKGRTKWMEKTIKVTILPSRTKEKELQKAKKRTLDLANKLIAFKKHANTATAFHHLVYKRFKHLGLHSQLQEAVQRKVYAAKKVKGFTHLPLEFNFPRSGGVKQTKRGNPVLAISPFKKRLAIPIRKDRGWKRLIHFEHEGWEAHSCKVFKQKGTWTAHIIIRKEPPPPQDVEGVIGLDIGRKVAAVITLNHPAFPLIHRYLGKDIAWKQHRFDKRRRLLRKYRDKGSKQARRALKRLRKKERQFNKTRCEQVAHEIISLAKSTRSAIAIEDMEKIRTQWTKKNSTKTNMTKRTRRSLNKWPFRLFLTILTSLATQHSIPLVEVDPHYTSQTCSRCGRKHKSSRVTRDLFRCHFCGFEVNSDRNASRNIALLGLSRLSLPLFSSWSSYLPVPRERKHPLFSVSAVEAQSTVSSGSMNGSTLTR